MKREFNLPTVIESLQSLANQRNYPCIAATRSINKNEFNVSLFDRLGTHTEVARLGDDLREFLKKIELTRSPYLTYFAVYDGPDENSEEEFENRLWQELSHLASCDTKIATWDSRFSNNPQDKNFCFSFDGKAFFVVGLHPKASRPGRKFFKPTLVFNAFDQFELLKERGEYEPMVDLNRRRDQKFSGSANPMAVLYGEVWESIQYSGRENAPEWQCPYQHLQQASSWTTITPQSGTAFTLPSGATLEVVDPEGQQVADLFCVTAEDVSERFSSTHTLDYCDTLLLTRGHALYSNRSRPLLEIITDECGRHDLLMPPCSERMFQIVENTTKSYKSCHGNLTQALMPFGVHESDITNTFNIFMNVHFKNDGQVEIRTPLSGPQTKISFKACTDLIVGLTACSHPDSNGGCCKPIQYRILLAHAETNL